VLSLPAAGHPSPVTALECSAVQCSAVQCSAVQCYVPFRAAPGLAVRLLISRNVPRSHVHPCYLECRAVQCNAVQCSTVQCSAVQCTHAICCAVLLAYFQKRALECSVMCDIVRLPPPSCATPGMCKGGRTQQAPLLHVSWGAGYTCPWCHQVYISDNSMVSAVSMSF
jgi:hypothetical protein